MFEDEHSTSKPDLSTSMDEGVDVGVNEKKNLEDYHVVYILAETFPKLLANL